MENQSKGITIIIDMRDSLASSFDGHYADSLFTLLHVSVIIMCISNNYHCCCRMVIRYTLIVFTLLKLHRGSNHFRSYDHIQTCNKMGRYYYKPLPLLITTPLSLDQTLYSVFSLFLHSSFLVTQFFRWYCRHALVHTLIRSNDTPSIPCSQYSNNSTPKTDKTSCSTRW